MGSALRMENAHNQSFDSVHNNMDTRDEVFSRDVLRGISPSRRYTVTRFIEVRGLEVGAAWKSQEGRSPDGNPTAGLSEKPVVFQFLKEKRAESFRKSSNSAEEEKQIKKDLVLDWLCKMPENN